MDKKDPFIGTRRGVVSSGVTLSSKDEAGADPRALATPYGAPEVARSIGQIASSFGGFIVVCAAMYFAYGWSYWIVLALAFLAAGFLVRIFIIQHDCGHGSFFQSKRANYSVGFCCSLLTLTPYASWRRQHAGHHGVWNDLDRRQSGADIYSSCITVAEYNALNRRQQWLYRFTRHPVVSNILLPPLVFLLLYRFPFDTAKSWRRERRGVYVTDIALVALLLLLGTLVGFERVAAVQLPVMIIASIVGVWLFSVQHRFEHTSWVRHDDWDFNRAALLGSSHLRLPRLLQWFTGNIGFHHVHHLNPRIPNYRLQECHDANPVMSETPVLTFWSGLRQGRFALWDEKLGRMVPFSGAVETG